MSKAYDFLKECGFFYVLTIDGDYPTGRPFGAVMEVGDDLYLATNDYNEAHKQLRENGHVRILAKKTTTESGFASRVSQVNAQILFCVRKCMRKYRF